MSKSSVSDKEKVLKYRPSLEERKRRRYTSRVLRLWQIFLCHKKYEILRSQMEMNAPMESNDLFIVLSRARVGEIQHHLVKFFDHN